MFWYGSCPNQSFFSLFSFLFNPAFGWVFFVVGFFSCLSWVPLLQIQGSLAAEPRKLWHGSIFRAAVMVGEGRGRNAKSPFPSSLKLKRPGRMFSLKATSGNNSARAAPVIWGGRLGSGGRKGGVFFPTGRADLSLWKWGMLNCVLLLPPLLPSSSVPGMQVIIFTY